MSNTSPGWYPDSSDASQMRYWDGQKWTEHTAPAGQSQAGPGAPGAPGGAFGTPTPAKKNWFLRHKILSAVLAVIVIAIIASAASGGGGSDDSPTASDDSTTGATDKPKADDKKSEEPTKEAAPEPEPQAMKVTAGQILKDYENNEAAADGKYKDQTLQITGVIDKVDTELFDDSEYVVNIGNGSPYAFTTVNCDDQSSDDVSSLKKGDDITVVADFEDGGDLGIELKNCSIQ